MISELAVWLILLLPLASFVICALVIRPFLNHQSHLAGLVTIAAVGVAFVLSLWAFASVVVAHGRVDFPNHSWLVVDNFELTVGVLLDPLTAIMLVVVSGVSLVVQVYSMGYMRGGPGLRALLRLHVAVHRLDAWAGDREQRHLAVRVLGASRPGFVPAHRLLVPAARRGRCGEEGVSDDAARRLRVPSRDHVPVLQRRRVHGAGAEPVGDSGHLRGRGRRSDRRGSGWLDRRGSVRWRGGQVGAVPAAHLAAGRDGGPHAGERADSRGDHGGCGRVPGGSIHAAVRAVPAGDDAGGAHRRRHRAVRGVDGPGGHRHQASARLLDRQPVGIYDAGAGSRRVRSRAVSPVHPRLLQGAALPRLGQREPRHWHLRHAVHGRAAQGDALDPRDVSCGRA